MCTCTVCVQEIDTDGRGGWGGRGGGSYHLIELIN
jgi:hypothetical protein